MAQYSFDQLVDITQVRQLLETHHTLTGMAYGVFDTGERNLIAVGWQDICLQFHRVHPVSCAYCRESDASIKERLHDFAGDFLEYRCKNGMIDVAMPIVIDGEHMATFFTGQFFYDDNRPDPEYFRIQSSALGFDTDGYLAALERVPVFSRDFIHNNMLFLRNMVNVLVRCGFDNLKLTREIEERRRAEKALRESEEIQRRFLENMPAGCIWMDIDGNIEYINKYLVEVFGYTLNEIPTLQVLFAHIFPDPEQRQRAHAAHIGTFFRQKKTGTLPESLETRITRKDGTIRQVIVNAHPIGNRILAVLTDITEREHIRHELLKAQKLESLGILAGGIAHDFRNILTAINSHISIAEISLEPSSKVHQSLEIAKIASLRATELTRRLISFTKGDPLARKKISARRMIGELVSISLQRHDIRWETTFEDTLDDIEADEGQIGQVFNNIIVNAMQSMPNGGTLSVRAGNTTPDECKAMELPPGPFIKISIADEGFGIAEEDQKRIFDPYFTTKSHGNGLGLASCHSIVTKHGGRILLSSAVGSGSTFTIYLPSLGHSLKDGHDRQTIPIQPGENGAILVMDDDAMIRSHVADMLHQLGYRSTLCTDGREAVTLCREAREKGVPFAAVVMDLQIPGGMGGDEASRHILKDDSRARLIISSASNHPILERYADYGFAAVLPKPYTVGQLAKVLESMRRDTQN